jgi:predicted O-linked N-acetylglucosamine transferase (SPINDLY family)
MGVPAITMESQYVGHRVAMCVLTNAGFPEFIAANDEEYLKIASELITDRKRLDKLRLGLRERIKASPICNSKSQARDIEGVYRKIWQTWCASQSNSQDFNK